MSNSTQSEQDNIITPPAMPISINLQYLKDLSFEVPAGAAIFTELTAPPQVGINIDVQVNKLQKDQDVFEVSLLIRAEAKETLENHDDNSGRIIFIAELNYSAVVTLDNPPAEAVEPILLVEVPRLLFPTARAIISDITREGSFPPVVLQPIDFVAMWHAKKERDFPETAGEA